MTVKPEASFFLQKTSAKKAKRTEHRWKTVRLDGHRSTSDFRRDDLHLSVVYAAPTPSASGPSLPRRRKSSDDRRHSIVDGDESVIRSKSTDFCRKLFAVLRLRVDYRATWKSPQHLVRRSATTGSDLRAGDGCGVNEALLLPPDVSPSMQLLVDDGKRNVARAIDRKRIRRRIVDSGRRYWKPGRVERRTRR